MPPTAHRRHGASAGGRRAFTLVELVTAASLMTIMMLGVVQVFAIITKTASDAEGLSFAQQQARALLDRLHDDLRGMTREGYLCIKHNTYNGPPGNSEYYCDTLAFVTIGPCFSSWTSTPYAGGAAEVVYTNNVVEPDYYNTKKAATDTGDPRKGLLGRGQWLWRPDGMPGTTGDTGDSPYSTGTPNYLCDMFAAQPDMNPSSSRIDRVAKCPPPAGGKIGYLRIWPWRTLTGISLNPQSLRRVMASCVSDFYVESYNPSGTDANTRFDWIDDFYQWGTRFTIDAPTNNNTPAPYHTLKSWPRALRVTVAIHDPGDNRPPPTLAPGATATRFQGYAFQETFWIADP